MFKKTINFCIGLLLIVSIFVAVVLPTDINIFSQAEAIYHAQLSTPPTTMCFFGGSQILRKLGVRECP